MTMGLAIRSLATIFLVFGFEGGHDLQARVPGKTPFTYGILIPDSASMALAWEFPRDPRLDTAGLDVMTAEGILRGFMLFTNTCGISPRFTGGTMTCNNCHPNGGQRDRAMPLVGIGRVFPEYNKRAGRPFTLEERIVGCFLRSVNAIGSSEKNVVLHHENELDGATLTPESREVRDLAVYIRWLSPIRSSDSTLPWRGHNQIAVQSLVPRPPTSGK